jgi:MoaA/NifB/PqqE/SkfB family radical SAM enzyme
MTKLSENSYNHNLRQDERKLTIWRYAGLMLTYKCPASCEFCYYNCSPDKGGLMSIETAMNAWQSLIDLIGPTAQIHITGGEPFLYFDHLVELLAEAQQRKLIGLDAIETNAYWAKDRDTVLKKLKILKALGIKRVKISWDPFHAEYIDEENVILLAETAKEVVGPENVRVRWDKYLGSGIDMKSLDLTQRCEMYKQGMRDFSVRLSGRAASKLAPMIEGKLVKELTVQNCANPFLSSKGVHIDPYGNVFSGLCSGISLGNVTKDSLKDIWKSFDPLNMPLVGRLVKGSPGALLDEAADLGFEVQPKYGSKCHLCSEVRQFFFDKAQYYPIISPAECYS